MTRSGARALIGWGVSLTAIALILIWVFEPRSDTAADARIAGSKLADLPKQERPDGRAVGKKDRGGEKREYVGGKAFLLTDSGQVPEGDASKILERLRPLANAGDAAAAYAIYLKVLDCKNKKDAPVDDNALRQYAKVGAASERLAQVESAMKDCEGLTATDYQNAGQWLEMAAENGSVAAKLLYAADPEVVLGTPDQMLKDPEKIVAYKQKSLHFLSDAAALGSVDALLSLGDAYEMGVLTEKDAVRGLAYYSAVRLVDGNLIPKNRVSSLEKSLSADQRSTALQQGRSIYEKCCAP